MEAYEFKARKVPPPPVKFPRVTQFFNTSFSAGIILLGKKNTIRVIHGNLETASNGVSE